ncbi:MAG: succinate dehydrogenase cytochrome b subunit [Phycisphaerales bacterium]|nr:succinate dehydrogenase cytochrome b subunit [Phycisphaerales bacterium]
MRLLKFYQSSIGKKIVAAVTGAILFLFLVAHMLGNLKIYSGAEKIDAYSLHLRTFMEGFFGFGGFLWIARVVLLVAVVLHITSVVLLIRQNRQARPIRYRRKRRFATSIAALSMILTGPWILVYIVLHILQFTTGTLQPTPFKETPQGIGAVYFNLWNAFQVWWIAALYVVSMAFICLHLYHGLWSMFQSVGWNNPDRNRNVRLFATISSIALFLGFSSVPVLVWADVVPPPAGQDGTVVVEKVGVESPALVAEGQDSRD